MMKGVLLFVLACFVLADDCGSFTCNCDEESKSIVSYDVESGEGRIAKTLERIVAYYGEEKCGGDPIYELHSSFSLVLDSTNGTTSIYNRTLTSNVVKFTGDKGISELGCTGVSTGNSIDLVKEEDRLKCNQEKIAPFIFPEVSHFNMLFSGVYLANPDKENEQCEMISVNLCYVEYPKRVILIPMYVMDILITVVVIIIYSIIWKKGKKTLPITQPKEETVAKEGIAPSTEAPKEGVVEPSQPQEVPAEPTTPVVPESVSSLENAASQAASAII